MDNYDEYLQRARLMTSIHAMPKQEKAKEEATDVCTADSSSAPEHQSTGPCADITEQVAAQQKKRQKAKTAAAAASKTTKKKKALKRL